MNEEVKRIDVGVVTAFADAKRAATPYPYDREKFRQDLANLGTTAAEVEANRQEVADNTQTVADDKTAVEADKASAAQSAAAAAQSAADAHTDALAATAAKEAAQTAQGSAVEAKEAAVSAKTSAENAQTEADQSARAAAGSALVAGEAARTATAQAGAAADSATAAAASAASVSGVVQEVTAAKTEALAAIETKGAETLDSIPDDYTELSGDVADLKSAMLSINGFTKTNISEGTTWTQGSINTAGSNSNSDMAIRYPNAVDDAIDISDCSTIQLAINNGYQIIIYWYDENHAYISRNRNITGDIDYIPVSGSKYIRLVLSKTDSTNIMPSDSDNVTVDLIHADGMIDPDYFLGTDNQKLVTAMAIAKNTSCVIAIKRQYTLTEDLPISNSGSSNRKIVLLGLGKQCGIKCGAYMIRAYDTEANYGMISIINLCFAGSATIFKADYLTRVNFINCTFSGGNKVINNTRYMQTWLFCNCVFRDSKTAVVYSDGAQGSVMPQMIDVHFSQCTIEASNDFIFAYSIQGVTIDQCCIEGLSGYVCKCVYEACNLSVTNSYFETNNCRKLNPDYDPSQPQGDDNPRYIGTGNNGVNFDFTEITRNGIEITISNNRFKGTIYAPDTASNIIALPALIPTSGYITISGNYVNVDEGVYLVKAHPNATDVYAHVILIGNRGDTYDGGPNSLLKWYQVT